jgi:hypothetical protein
LSSFVVYGTLTFPTAAIAPFASERAIARRNVSVLFLFIATAAISARRSLIAPRKCMTEQPIARRRDEMR